MDTRRLTEKAQEALQSAIALAERQQNSQVEPIHLLVALLDQPDGIVGRVIDKAGGNSAALLRQARAEMNRLPRISGDVQVSMSSALRKVVLNAYEQMKPFNDEFVSTEHLLLALMAEGGREVKTLLSNAGVNETNVLAALRDIRGSQRVTSANPEATYAWTASGRTQADDQGRAKSYLTAANACHVVAVEIDPDTGKVDIAGYWIADDCGTRLNPANVEGQTQGGVAQGVGAALLEEYVYNEDAQLLTSTFMDYLLPTIYEVPFTEKQALCTPSPFAPLGAKGCGEGAIHTTPAAVLCAINDALAPLGAQIHEMPASPVRVWKAIQEAKNR